jgi:hypothetical protein
METKRCTKCNEDLPATEKFFNRKKSSKDGLYCWCKKCKNKRQQEWSIENRDEIREYKKEYYLKNRYKKLQYEKEYAKNKPHKCRERRVKSLYGIDGKGLQDLMNEQKGCCAICGESLVTPQTTRNYSVDHDHATGKVRGLLCGNCNAAVGLVNEDISICKSLIEYLRKYDATDSI